MLPAEGWSGKDVLLLVALTGLAIVGNFFSAPISFGFDFLFGSVATLLVVSRFGAAWGAIVAALAGTYTIVLWNHPYAIIIMAAEAVVVATLSRRLRDNVLLADGIFWAALGIPLVFGFYFGLLDEGLTATALIALKQAVNGIFNALVANVLVSSIPYLRAKSERPSRRVAVHRLLFNLLVAMVLLPTLGILAAGARAEVERIDQDVGARLEIAADAISTFLQEQQDRQYQAVQTLTRFARSEGFRPSERLQVVTATLRAAFPSFHNMYVADASGTSIAFDPPRNERGDSTVGISFADRPYFSEMLETRALVVSEVFQGRGGVFVPIVTLSAPSFAEDGAFQGFALAALDLGGLGAVLRRTVPSGFRAIVVDRDGDVVATSESDIVPLAPLFEQREGTLIERSATGYQWIPRQSGQRTKMSDWKSSYYGTRRPVGPLGRWQLLIEAPLRPHQQYLEERYIRVFAIMLAVSLVSLVLAQLMSDMLTAPLRELAEATSGLPDNLRAGHLPQWPATHVVEIESLVNNFRDTAEALQRYIRQLEAEIAERRRAEDALRRADQAKDEFLAMLAHELRNPLAPMTTAVELLRIRDPESAARDRPLVILDRQLRHMVRMVDDLLDVSRITRGKVELRREAADLRNVVRGAVESVQPIIQARQHTLSVETPDAPVIAVVDTTRVEQIVTNLLHNSAKYTDPGGQIHLSLCVENGEAVLSVKDNGVGIPAAMLPHVFELFTQVDRTLDRSQGGLGIGLTLVNRLAELHGGSISAMSDGPGCGSTFVVRLPLTDEADPAG